MRTRAKKNIFYTVLWVHMQSQKVCMVEPVVFDIFLFEYNEKTNIERLQMDLFKRNVSKHSFTYLETFINIVKLPNPGQNQLRYSRAYITV